MENIKNATRLDDEQRADKNEYQTVSDAPGKSADNAVKDALTEDLTKKITALEEDLKKERERSSYVLADFETFRRRSDRECKQLVDNARIKIFTDLLSVLDDFDRALAEVERAPELLPYVTGFELTRKSLLMMLASHGVVPMEIAESQVFDPNFHEAVLQVDVPGKQSGEIVSVLQKGYLFNDTLLRPAKVTVNK